VAPLEITSDHLLYMKTHPHQAKAQLVSAAEVKVHSLEAVISSTVPHKLVYLINHGSIQPYHMFCSIISHTETYDESPGFPPYIGFWYSAQQWLFGLSPLLRTVVWVYVAFPAVFVAVILGWFAANCTFMHFVAAAFGFFIWKSLSKVPSTSAKSLCICAFQNIAFACEKMWTENNWKLKMWSHNNRYKSRSMLIIFY